VLGQRISVRVATILAGKVAHTFGEEIEAPVAQLRRVFPAATTIADVSPQRLRAIGLGGPPVQAILPPAPGVAPGGLVLERGAWCGGDARSFTRIRAQLEAYFAGELTQFGLPLVAQGTPFQQRVWEELRKIPFAQTWSYGELARKLGDPNASRAVGLANGRN